MKKILSLFVLCSFLAVGVTANACDGHKKASKASTEVAKTPVTTASTAVTKDAKKAECTPAEKAACVDKASTKAGCGTEGVKTTSTDATGAEKAKSCCPKGAAKKTMAAKKS